jgi:hypothetical protein
LPAIDRETAVAFDKRINLALRYLFVAGTEVRDKIDPKYAHIYDRALGHACQELDGGVLELIYQAHPDLRPDFLGGTRKMEDLETPD